jgi:hypothetical protein
MQPGTLMTRPQGGSGDKQELIIENPVRRGRRRMNGRKWTKLKMKKE